MEFVKRPVEWIRRGTVAMVVGGGALLLGIVLISWFASLNRPHGVMVTGFRRFGVIADDGIIQFRYATKTDIVQSGANAWSVEELGFRPANEPLEIDCRSNWPRVVLSPWKLGARAEIMFGGQAPLPSTGRMATFGEQTFVRGLPHWMLALLLATPMAWWWFVHVRRRRAASRRSAGLCIVCGYDIRATTERCPECGVVAGQGAGPSRPAGI